ncbi:MAG: peptidylprolyl isomerase [Deltaproteobacteria bacterium]|nr:peptidylprolyl isomerase [Deltaproteobacteria bacterium]
MFDHEPDDVIIEIGSTCLTPDTLKKEMKFMSGGMPVQAEHAEEIKKQLLSQIIDYHLILEYAKKNGISVSEEDFQKNLNEIKKEYTENDFQEALLREYVDPASWEDRFRNQLLVSKVIKEASKGILPPSYEEIKRYFQENRNDFRSAEMLRFRQIVCKSKEEVEKLRERLQAGEDMGALAREYSIAPEAENNGEVGWVARGDLDEAMEKALFSMQHGASSPIVKTDFGYHLFEVIARRPAGLKELPEVIDKIESTLLWQRHEDFHKKWLKKLRSEFKVKINQDMLAKLKLS